MKFILFIFSLLATFSASAAEVAYVVSEKAIIYSDMELTIPIGYARRGKKIKVGEVARKHGTVLPTVVSGRVAYVKRDDIQLAEELAKDGGTYVTPKVTDHEVLFEEQKFEDNFAENNHVILMSGSMGTGNEWKELAGSQESATLSTIGVGIEHRPELRNYSWAVGLNYISSELEQYAFKSIFIEARFQYSLLRFDWMALDIMAGVAGSGDARLLNSQTAQEARGTLFGYFAGGLVKFFPFSQFGIIGGAEIRKYNVGSIGEIDVGDGTTTQFKGFNGAQLWAGITYKL